MRLQRSATAVIAACVVVWMTHRPDTVLAAGAPFTATVPVLNNPPAHFENSTKNWVDASMLNLGWDFTYKRSAYERTNVYVAQSSNALYIKFDVINQNQSRRRNGQTARGS